MSQKSNIEWTDATWNPVVGCTKVSPGCKNCYAETLHSRRNAAYVEGKAVPEQYAMPFETVQTLPERLDAPLHWKKPRRIFVNSMSDLFHEDIADEFIQAVFTVMSKARQHTFQVLTKRAKRMREILTRWQHHGLTLREGYGVCLPNAWLGVSVEDQKRADERIPELLRTPAAVRFISAEPLLGAVELKGLGEERAARVPSGGLDWVICGGESGKDARPMHPDWARGLRDQCEAAGVPFFFKQWGEWAPAIAGDVVTLSGGRFSADTRVDDLERAIEHGGATMQRYGKKVAGRLLDGFLYDGMPGITFKGAPVSWRSSNQGAEAR